MGYKYKDYCECKEEKCSCGCKYERKCKCYEKEDKCKKNKELLEEAYDYSERARISILSIFGHESICDNAEVIEYFYENAKEAVICLFKTLEKLSYDFKRECYYCDCEAAYTLQRAIRNTETVACVWESIPSIDKICEYECKYCEAVGLVRVALERIEDVVREIETLFKLFKDEC